MEVAFLDTGSKILQMSPRQLKGVDTGITL